MAPRRVKPASIPSRILTDLDGLRDKVAAAVPDTLVRVNGTTIHWDALPQRYPHLSRRLTSDWIGNFIVE